MSLLSSLDDFWLEVSYRSALLERESLQYYIAARTV
jgi:hypothetical protein